MCRIYRLSKTKTRTKISVECSLDKSRKSSEVYVRVCVFQEVKDQSSSVLEGNEVRWVITVPAVWRQPAKQFMREAAYLVTA